MITKSELKFLRSLHHKKFRQKHQQFLIEGTRIIEEAISGNCQIVKVWHLSNLDERQQGLIKECEKKNIPAVTISDRYLSQISDTVHHQGILALARLPEEEEISKGSKSNWLYLDNIRDPGNLGTILRTADWFGINRVALSPKCVDVYNSKVLRSGMGAHFHLAAHTGVNLTQIKNMGHTIIASDPKGKLISKYQAQTHKNWCLILGCEAHGISDDIKPLVDHYVVIPGKGKAESLNVAVASGIMMYLLH